MTYQQKYLIQSLFKGMVLVKTRNHRSQIVYKLFDNNMNVERYVAIKVVEKYPVKNLLKKDKRGRLSINLMEVRKLHGRSFIKKEYKKLLTRRKEQNASPVASHTCTA